MLKYITSVAFLLFLICADARAQGARTPKVLFSIEKEVADQEIQLSVTDIDNNYVRDFVFNLRTQDNIYLMTSRCNGPLQYRQPEVLFDLKSIEGVWKDTFKVDEVEIKYTLVDYDADKDDDIAVFYQDAACSYISIHVNDKGDFSEVVKIYESLDRIEKPGLFESVGLTEGDFTFLMLEDKGAGLVYIIRRPASDGVWKLMGPLNIEADQGLAVLDFDQDEDMDLLLTHPVSDQIGVYQNRYNTGFHYRELSSTWQWTENMKIYEMGDLIANGKKDLLLTDKTTQPNQKEHMAYLIGFDEIYQNFAIKDTLDIGTGKTRTAQEIRLYDASLGNTNMGDIVIHKGDDLFYFPNEVDHFGSAVTIGTKGMSGFRFVDALKLSMGGGDEIILSSETDLKLDIYVLQKDR